MQKVLEIIAGPNGSGKTTFAETGLKKRKESLYFNSDNFAKAMTLNGSKYAQFEAGRMLLKKVNDCLNEKRSFSFESTLSGRNWVNHIVQAKKQGYYISVYFVFVKSIKLSLERIKNRVKHGGHDIPKEIVERRFERTFSNFVNLYAPLADEWHVIDNSDNAIEIAAMKNGKISIFEEKTFNKFFK